MVVPSIFRIAASAIWANKLRSGLTLLGVILGVTSVMTIISALEGITNTFANQIGRLGGQTFYVQRFGIITSREEFLKQIKRPNVENFYGDLIREACDDCDRVSIMTDRGANVTYRNSSRRVSVIGSESSYIDIYDLEVAQGRFHSTEDDLARRNVAFIGESVRESFFSEVDPIGQAIRINGERFFVIGVAQSQGAIFGNDQDNFIVVPYGAWAKLFGPRDSDMAFAVRARSLEVMPDAMDQVRLALRSERKVPYNDEDNFAMLTADDIITFFNSFTQLARLALVAISSISVVVGGIVVMNIMMVAVTERTREIGIRKSIGARKKHILWQFLFESLFLTLGGGVVGIGIGFLLAYWLVTQINMEIEPSSFAIGVGLSISTGIGLIFGIYPALKAARLDPIKALSYE